MTRPPTDLPTLDADDDTVPSSTLAPVSFEQQWILRLADGRALPAHLVELLQAVHQRGSLLAASIVVGTSYRRAWELLKDAEARLQAPLLMRTRGQGSRLTAIGHDLLRADARARATMTEADAGTGRSPLDAPGAGADMPLRLHASFGPAIATLRQALDGTGIDVWFRDVPATAAAEALAAGRCDVAGFCLPDAGLEDRTRHLLEAAGVGEPCRLLHLARRARGGTGAESCVVVWRETSGTMPAVRSMSDVLRGAAFRGAIQRLEDHDAERTGELRLLSPRMPEPEGTAGHARPAAAEARTDDAPQAPHAALRALLSRRSVSPKRLAPPAPSAAELDLMLQSALRAPDHGRLTPWRVLEIRPAQRELLADLFEQERLRRDPLSSAADRRRAREHATRPPGLLAFIVTPRARSPVPLLEQCLAAGAALGNLLDAAHLLGYGAIMLSGERCADATLATRLGLARDEQLAGFISLGSITEPPPEAAERLSTEAWSCWLPGEERDHPARDQP